MQAAVDGHKMDPLAIFQQKGFGPGVRTARFRRLREVLPIPEVSVRRVVRSPPQELARSGRIVPNRGWCKPRFHSSSTETCVTAIRMVVRWQDAACRCAQYQVRTPLSRRWQRTATRTLHRQEQGIASFLSSLETPPLRHEGRSSWHRWVAPTYDLRPPTYDQYFRSTPMTRPWTWTWAAGTMMGCMAALEGCRRVLSPSR